MKEGCIYMVQRGLTKVVDVPDVLGEHDILRNFCNKFVEKVVEEGHWFSFCTRISEEQTDIMAIKNKDGISLGHMVREIYDEMEYRPAIYKVLLREYLCYYEAPMIMRERNAGGFKSSYNKFLATSNINVIAEWLDISFEEADAEYGGKLQFYDDDLSNLVPYYKLYVNKEGIHKVTKTRADLDLSEKGTRVVPLFALKHGMDVLYKKMLEDTYDITFCKDNSQERVINSTFNVEKVKEVYTDPSYVSRAVEDWYDGEFLSNPSIERGYIRVFEMGTSIYDSPLRSINYARIIKFEKALPDLSYLNIDLDSVVDEFKKRVNGNTKINRELPQVVEALDLFDVGSSRKVANVEINSIHSLITWADDQLLLLSTVFQRSLALFMLGNPQWFEGYTGEPMSSSNTGSDTPDDWDDFELDLG